MTDLPYRLMMVTTFTAHEVGFQSAKAIEDVFALDAPLTQDQVAMILKASNAGTPLFAGLDPFEEQINWRNVLVFSDTKEGVREQQTESVMNI